MTAQGWAHRAPEKSFRVWRAARIAAGVALLALSLTGCGITHIRVLREAEDSFNNAAAADNRNRLDQAFELVDSSEIANAHRLSSSAAVGDASRAATGYRVAAKLADELISKKKKELLADDLLCTAYVIKAMSQWRLGDYDSAMQTAKEGTGCNASSGSTPRESALLAAVGGLARIDDAYAVLMNQKTGLVEYQKIRKEVEEALSILTSAAAGVSADHPVRAYLLIARMAAIRVWQSAVDQKEVTGPTRIAELKDANDAAKAVLQEYAKFLECQLHRKNDASVTHWQKLFGVGPPAAVTCQ